jgi:predicted nucleic acid-binding protein
MIFVDTGAWYASVVADDVNHSAAAQWLKQNSEILLTTDYVIDETLTLLKVRGHLLLAVELGRGLFAGELANVVLVAEQDLHQAWEVFQQFRDKEWSFTDCTSKVVMEKLAIRQAFSFDHHFRQFGTVIVVPRS